MAKLTVQDLPQSVPVLPLPGALLLPRARLPLHIFEPRYLALIEDALRHPQRMIAVVQPRAAEGDALCDVGCLGRLTSFAETDDGRYMVTLKGLVRFKVGDEIDGFSPYRKIAPKYDAFLRDLSGTEHDTTFDRDSFMDLLSRYFETQDLSTDWESLRDVDDEMLINSLSILCPFSSEEKQALLEAKTLTERRQSLTVLMEFAAHTTGQDDKMQ